MAVFGRRRPAAVGAEQTPGGAEQAPCGAVVLVVRDRRMARWFYFAAWHNNGVDRRPPAGGAEWVFVCLSSVAAAGRCGRRRRRRRPVVWTGRRRGIFLLIGRGIEQLRSVFFYSFFCF